MSSSPSVIHVYGDLLDHLLHAYGETQEQWNAPFDPSPILPELSKENSTNTIRIIISLTW